MSAANTRYKSARFSLSALASVIAGVTACTVHAQQQELEEISVTGSRIQRDVGFESPVPVTALSSEELGMFEPGLGVSQQLENLPQYFGNVSSDDVAGRVGADVGQSQLNMRGMGGERTLVLLDGSRIVPSDRRSSVSVDYLPSPLIRRVDVVTGGASAAYGADALAGVTNFILDRQYTGFEVTGRAGINEFGDGENTRFTAAWGDDLGPSDRLHLFGSLEVRNNRDSRRGRERPYEVEWDDFGGYVRNPAWSNNAPPGTPLRLTAKYVVPTNSTSTGLLTAPGSALHRTYFNEAGTDVVPFVDGANASYGGPGNQNNMASEPGEYLYDLWRRGRYIEDRVRLRVELQTAFLGADFQLTDGITLWGHTMYGRTRNTSPATQTGGHAGLSYMTIYQENAFLPESVRQTMIDEGRSSVRMDAQGWSMVPWGYQERPTVTNYMYSSTGGFDAELGGDWNVRGSYQFGTANKESILKNWERNDRFFMAMDAVEDPENPGDVVCRIQLVAREFQRQGRNLEAELHQWAQEDGPLVYRTDNEVPFDTPVRLDYPFAVDSIDQTISDCVPVNMFGLGNQSREALDYIFSSRHKTADSIQKQHFAEVVANGTLYENWGPGPISAAIGATWRDESIYQKVRDVAIDVLGPPQNVTLSDGTVVMRGIAPGIQGGSANLHRFGSQPSFAGEFDVKELFVETIVPLFDRETGPQYAEVNLAGRYADYSRAGEIAVWKAGLSLQATEDLRLRATLSHDIREGSFAELFVQQGGGGTPVDRFLNNEAYLISSLSGGNPEIEAEEADTRVIGFVYQPSFLDGLQFSLDRYVVDLSSAIGQYTVQQIVDQCFESGALCERIDRNVDGRISLIRNTFLNIDAAKVSGWDMEISYRAEPDFLDAEFETLSLRLLGGHMDENSTTPLGGNRIERAGSVDLPKTVLTAIMNYNFGDFGVSLLHNWNSSTKRNLQWVEGVDVDDNDMPSWHNTNLGLSWSGSSNWGDWRASFNITNLFDNEPEQRGTHIVGDEVGRRYSLGFQQTF